MSRAFTKEDDAGEDLPERPIPAGPNYVTPRGLRLLKEAGQRLVDRKKKAADGEDLRPIDRDLRYLEARINSALLVPPGSGSEIRFGARVEIEEPSGQRKVFQIVGEDEARTEPDTLSWSSPLVSALFGAKTGETVMWESPDGNVPLKVISVIYPS